MDAPRKPDNRLDPRAGTPPERPEDAPKPKPPPERPTDQDGAPE